ncbi:uncharacterized protein ACIQIH_003910 isoform 2-T3 [Cyanocitta cristata]
MAAGGRQASPPQMNPPTPASLCVVRRRRRRCHSQSASDPAPVTAAEAPLTRARSERRREGAQAALARGGGGGGSRIRVLRRAGGWGEAVTSSGEVGEQNGREAIVESSGAEEILSRVVNSSLPVAGPGQM